MSRSRFIVAAGVVLALVFGATFWWLHVGESRRGPNDVVTIVVVV